MSSPEQRKQQKLTKVLGFYQKQADVLAEKSQQVSGQLADLKQQSGQLDYEMDQQEIHFVTLHATPTNRMMAHQSLQRLAERQRQKQLQIQTASEELELVRRNLTSLMGKVESIEKLIDRLSESIRLEHRKHEQIVADERYLNTQFSNRSLT
jgi:flagellar biosynthesis chaperone FliJ